MHGCITRAKPTCEHCLLASSTLSASRVRTPMRRCGCTAALAAAMRRRASLLALPQVFLTL
jgi:predicted naringenin-chalcone synthase